LLHSVFFLCSKFPKTTGLFSQLQQRLWWLTEKKEGINLRSNDVQRERHAGQLVVVLVGAGKAASVGRLKKKEID